MAKQAQQQIEIFYKNGAVSIPEKKLTKEVSVKEINMKLGKLDKIIGNPLLSAGQISNKPANHIVLEPLAEISPNQKKQIHIKNSLKFSKHESHNDYFEVNSTSSREEKQYPISVRRQTVNEFGQDDQKIEINKVNKA